MEMREMFRKQRKSMIGGCVVMGALALLFASTSLTAGNNNAPVIVSAVENTSVSPSQLTIVGSGFGTGQPAVTIGSSTPTILSYTDTNVVVQIPANIASAPGSYQLVLTTSGKNPNSPQASASFVASIGAPAQAASAIAPVANYTDGGSICCTPQIQNNAGSYQPALSGCGPSSPSGPCPGGAPGNGGPTNGTLSGTVPQVTATIGSDGQALVSLSTLINNTSLAFCSMSFIASGFTPTGSVLATGAPASVTPYAISRYNFASSVGVQTGATFLITGLTPGANTFTAAFMGQNCTFVNPGIIVQPF